MEKANRRLQAIFRMIGYNDFYNVSIMNDGEVNLQGDYKSGLVARLLKNKFKSNGISDSGHTYLKRGRIKVVLT